MRSREDAPPAGCAACRNAADWPGERAAAVTSDLTSPARLRFGPFVLDLRTAELSRGSSRVALPPQPARILALLARRPGQLVTRPEIQDAIWGDATHVDFDRALNFAVKQVREALGDDAETPTYVETLRGRGYRFLADVTVDDPPEAPPSSSRPRRRRHPRGHGGSSFPPRSPESRWCGWH